LCGGTFWGEFSREVDWSAIDDITSDDGHSPTMAKRKSAQELGWGSEIDDDGRQMWDPTFRS